MPMDMSISALSNFMLHTITGGNQVKDEKVKEKKSEDSKREDDEKRAEQQRLDMVQNVNKSEPGSMVDVFA